MHIVSHRGSSLSSPRHLIHACAPVRCVVVVLFTRLLFLFVPLLFFQTFQMSSSEFHERLKSKDLRDFRLGTVASSDHETPLTDSRLPSAVTDLFTVKNSKFFCTLRLFPQIDIEPPRYRLPCAINGHTIFEASAQNQTPTSLYASAKKTRMRNFVPMFLVLSSARFRRCIVDNAFLNSGSYLVGTESKCATLVWIHQLPR